MYFTFRYGKLHAYLKTLPQRKCDQCDISEVGIIWQEISLSLRKINYSCYFVNSICKFIQCPYTYRMDKDMFVINKYTPALFDDNVIQTIVWSENFITRLYYI